MSKRSHLNSFAYFTLEYHPHMQRAFYFGAMSLFITVFTFPFSSQITTFISCYNNLFPGYFFLTLTELGNGAFVLTTILLLKKNVAGRLFILALLSLTVQGLKHLFELPRPAVLLSEDVCLLGQVYNNFSFPSGHAATSFFTALLVLHKKPFLGILFILAGLSRVLVGAHFITDVAFSGILAALFYTCLGNEKDQIIRTPIFFVSLCILYMCSFNGPTDHETAFSILAIIAASVLIKLESSNSMKPPRRLCIFLLVIAAVIHPTSKKWLNYVFHLAKHQFEATFSTISIQDALKSPRLSKHEKENLKHLILIRPKIEKRLGLEDSKSFQRVRILDRDQLGYQLSFAYPFETQFKTFSFPAVGKFTYLGFFNLELAKKWKNDFERSGFDSHAGIIGAYSTLGILPDPLFSTYLQLSKQRITALLSHEMVHEKLFFTDDTYFSERIASYLEDRIIPNIQKNQPSGEKLTEDNLTQWNQWVDRLIEDLQFIYSSTASNELKMLRKEYFLSQQRKRLQQSYSKEFPNLIIARSMAFSDKLWNNASLLHLKRYRSASPGLDLLWSKTNQNPELFLDALAKGKSCTAAERRKLLNYNSWSQLSSSGCVSEI